VGDATVSITSVIHVSFQLSTYSFSLKPPNCIPDVSPPSPAAAVPPELPHAVNLVVIFQRRHSSLPLRYFFSNCFKSVV